MVWRYPAAAVVGYLSFLLCIAAWVAWHRARRFDGDVHLDALDIPGSSTSDGAPSNVLFTGGRSGGGGGGASWGIPVDRQPAAHLPDAFDADVGELWPFLVAAIALIGGVIAVAYTIYIAPVLLAEVLVDAAVVTAVYRRLRADESPRWAAGLVRRTFIPATALVVFLMIAGFALERLAPSARSIGGVIRALLV